MEANIKVQVNNFIETVVMEQIIIWEYKAEQISILEVTIDPVLQQT